MDVENKNIVLIGMPASGKSTVGVVLAKRLCRQFVDIDITIQNKFNKHLYDIIEENGLKNFCSIEEDAALAMGCNKCVIATGGSVIYSKKAMKYLQGNSIIVYLYAMIEDIATRIGDLDERGVVRCSNQTLEDLFAERTILYENYASVTIDTTEKSVLETVEELVKVFKS